jgi:hypothetical protein
MTSRQVRRLLRRLRRWLFRLLRRVLRWLARLPPLDLGGAVTSRRAQGQP